MGLNELARSLYGSTKSNINSQKSSQTRTTVISGVAISDSENGIVKVDVGGQVIDVKTETYVVKGQSLSINVTNHSMTGRGVIGNGDSLNSRTSIAVEKAEQAQQMAEIIDNHFFYDTDGAHVSEHEKPEEGQPIEGRHVTIHANGMFICGYNGAETIESSFTDIQAQIGRDDQSHLILRSKIMGFEPGGDDDGATFTIDTNRETLDAKTYDKAILSANTFNQIATVSTYAALEDYPITSSTPNGCAIKVTSDETRAGATTYYVLHKTAATAGYWSYIGTSGAANYSHLELQAGTKAQIILNDATTPKSADSDAQIQSLCNAPKCTDRNYSATTCVTQNEHCLQLQQYIDKTGETTKLYSASIPYTYIGVKNLYVSGTSIVLFTQAQFRELTGHKFDPSTDHITIMNAGGNAAHCQDVTAHVDNNLYATFDRTVGGNINIGYQVTSTQGYKASDW